MSTKLTKGLVGLLAYTLTDHEGTVIESTAPGQLFAYLHGHGNLPDALEQVVEGLEDGAAFDAQLPSPFGEPSGVAPRAVRRRDLPKGIRERAKVGDPFGAQAGDGTVHQLWITAIRGSQVWVTTEHPLAGKALRFQGVVRGIRAPTQGELEHGHAHGPGGKHRH